MNFGEIREPSTSEAAYFKENPRVAGMADFDSDTVVLNPHTKLSSEQRDAVHRNEMARLVMRRYKMAPDFDLTPEQSKAFESYGDGDPLTQKETVVGRIISGDKSAGSATSEQQAFAQRVRLLLDLLKPQNVLSPLERGTQLRYNTK